VKLKGIKKKTLPDLSDELAKKSWTVLKILMLKTQVRKDIVDGEEKRIQEEMKKQDRQGIGRCESR